MKRQIKEPRRQKTLGEIRQARREKEAIGNSLRGYVAKPRIITIDRVRNEH